MTHTELTDLATSYFDAWQAGDADALGRVLAEDCSFRGPLGTADDREGCIAGLLGMHAIIERVDVRAMTTSGTAEEGDVITFFDLRTTIADPAPTANWSHVVDGRIARVRVAFDPRGILAAG